MSKGFISRGFRGRRKSGDERGRIPPGPYLERGFPILSAGPTPYTSLAAWDFSLLGKVDPPKRWTWEAFRALPHEMVTADIHCVTKWSKLDTHWEGVSVDTLLAQVAYDATHVIAESSHAWDGDGHPLPLLRYSAHSRGAGKGALLAGYAGSARSSDQHRGLGLESNMMAGEKEKSRPAGKEACIGGKVNNAATTGNHC